MPIVILGIDKNLYLAKLGDEFTPVGDSSGLSIRVSTISDREVRLEVTPLGRSIILYQRRPKPRAFVRPEKPREGQGRGFIPWSAKPSLSPPGLFHNRSLSVTGCLEDSLSEKAVQDAGIPRCDKRDPVKSCVLGKVYLNPPLHSCRSYCRRPGEPVSHRIMAVPQDRHPVSNVPAMVRTFAIHSWRGLLRLAGGVSIRKPAGLFWAGLLLAATGAGLMAGRLMAAEPSRPPWVAPSA